MSEGDDVVVLVRQAQFGDQQSMDRLAEVARGRLWAYIYRLTLNHDLAQDLLQESLLKMIERIKDVEYPDRFWPWLFRTALGQVQHYYRDQARAREVEFSSAGRQRMSDYLSRTHDDGLNHLMRKELAETVVEAMAQLKLTYRSVLTLRCYEQMSYAEIADQMGCKEMGARVLFFRAKRSLHRRLARRGFGKGLLVTALGLFGLLTTPADGASAAGTVSAASLQVGALAAIVGFAGTPKGIAVMLTAAGMTFTFTVTFEHFLYAALIGGVVLVSLVAASVNWPD
ncbi:MAG: RNA polymerase sigma factor [Planctomycetota bacterium]